MPKRWHNVVETNVRPEGSGVTKDLLYVKPPATACRETVMRLRQLYSALQHSALEVAGLRDGQNLRMVPSLTAPLSYPHRSPYVRRG
jgi:hypothetical protein